TVSGQSFKGPTAGATVCAYAIDNAAADRKGAQVMAQEGSQPQLANGCVVTANDGTYSFALPAGTSGDLLFESSGGTYCSDESVFDGTSCAGTGTPIAMGAASLRTVVDTPAVGAVANAPLTLLTTAATTTAGTLSASTFKANYNTVAANFGLADTDPASKPDVDGALKTMLTGLTTFVGGDTRDLGRSVKIIAAGSLLVGSGNNISDTSLEAESAINCSPLAQSDLQFTMVGLSIGGVADPLNNVINPLPMMQTYPALGLGTANDSCLVSDDGLTSMRVMFSGNLGSLLNGHEVSGAYGVARFDNPSCQGQAASYGGTQASLRYDGIQTIPLSASNDPSRSQVGSASKLVLTLQPSSDLGITEVQTEHHLFCRTQASAPMTTNFKGFLTSPDSPKLNGFRSRLDGKHTLSGMVPT
ncbi:MAG: hypothetical protein HOQ10_00105, partial [Frateuria sp.]|nr:hypothetical protein [Frateuria sp.]